MQYHDHSSASEHCWKFSMRETYSHGKTKPLETCTFPEVLFCLRRKTRQESPVFLALVQPV